MTADEQPFRRRLLLNTGAVGVSNLWAIVISVVTLPLTLHGLGTSAFGTWVLLNTFSAMTGWFSLADLGAGAAATREVATCAASDDRAGVAHAIASTLVLFGVFGLVFAALFAAIGPSVLPHVFSTPEHLVAALQFAIVVFAVQVFVDQLTSATEDALDGLQRVDLSRAVDAFRRTLVAVAVAIVAEAGGGLQGAALASLAAAVLGALVSGIVLHRQQRGHWASPRVEVMRRLLSYGKSIAVLQPIGVITRQMDRLIAGAILGPTAVTLVEIATQVQNGASAVLIASSYVATPASSWVHAREERGLLRELVLRGTKYSLLMTYPVTIGAAILAPDLVHVWVGPAYAAAAGLVVLALLDLILSGPLQVGSNVLIGVGRAPDVLKAAVGAVVINLAASVVLAHLIGTAGVFLGTLLGLCFLVPFLARATCRQVGVRPVDFTRATVVPALLACIPMALVVGVVEWLPLRPVVTLVLGAGLGGVVYLATVLTLVLSGDERSEFRAVLRRSAASRDADVEPEADPDAARTATRPEVTGPAEDPVAHLHNSVAHDDDVVASTRPAGTTPKQLERMVHDVTTKLALDPGSSVCEIGCGTGVLAVPITRSVRRFVGVDFAAEALAVLDGRLGQAGLSDRATLLALDVLGPQFAELARLGPFDRVLVYATFHYVRDEPQLQQFLSRVVELLSPGGLALIGNLPLVDLADERRSPVGAASAAARVRTWVRWLNHETTPVPRDRRWKLRAAATSAWGAATRRLSARTARGRPATPPELPPGSVLPLRIAGLEQALEALDVATVHRWTAPAVGVPLFLDRADLLIQRSAAA